MVKNEEFNAKNFEMEMNVLNRGKWSLPLKIKLKNVTRNQSNIFDEIFQRLTSGKTLVQIVHG